MDLFNDLSPAGCPASDAGVLLYEYTHRVSNEFTSAISAVSIAAATSTNDEVKASLAAVGELLRNYARVHNALRMPERAIDIDAAAYLGRLCLAISRSKLDHQGIELVFVGRPLMVSSECGWRLGMIVSELVTNAVRHAFREHGGVIKIELIAAKSSIECHVTDNGTSQGDIRPGHGFRIVEALARGLNGRIVQHFGPRGATSVLSFPYAADPVEQQTTAASVRPHVETGNPYQHAASIS
jgi:two-component sensor histidine kinase